MNLKKLLNEDIIRLIYYKIHYNLLKNVHDELIEYCKKKHMIFSEDKELITQAVHINFLLVLSGSARLQYNI